MFPGPFTEDIWGAQYGGCSERDDCGPGENAVLIVDMHYTFQFFIINRLCKL